MKWSAEQCSWGGLLGIALALWGGSQWLDGRLSPGQLDSALRMGYARPAAALSRSSLVGSESGSQWFASFERALRIQLSAADRLKIDYPQEEDLVLLETDVQAAARYELVELGGSWAIVVRPYEGHAWTAPCHSGGPVRPAAYPSNGRIAYYDLGRIWIADLHGLKMQSLQHVPLLEQGGALYWDVGGTRLCWIGQKSGAAAAVELGVDER